MGELEFHSKQTISRWKTFECSQKKELLPIDDYSVDQAWLNEDKKWRAFFIYGYGHFNPSASNHFPELKTMVEKHSDHVSLVMFSNLQAGKTIPPHKGNNPFVLRIIMGVSVPEPESVGLVAAGVPRKVLEGKTDIFDDTLEHYAWNSGTLARTILIVDVIRPFWFPFNILARHFLDLLKQTEYVQRVVKKVNRC
ncbi:MAG: aspartyl/asparaginyl beta-hydroxylase domain-containing protein [Flavobacteriales bacterium]|nr:aspartyl/asparaginyl beta-hydroxylase domain-containing protein [Flavobacteriales bacterium]MCB9205115.1 aspartyl/asparaginyl beta-hydroxylase domain-containing protein [Flavobacteriales bacterium]